ncbi:hypothetical protein B0H19DRAFT_1066085 [Mycena capillaripes]|nr:hypothetical protein B0H19DRAFT_1066085 [Mycena capillaripes]
MLKRIKRVPLLMIPELVALVWSHLQPKDDRRGLLHKIYHGRWHNLPGVHRTLSIDRNLFGPYGHPTGSVSLSMPHTLNNSTLINFADLSTVFPSLSPYFPKNMVPNLLGVHWIHKENEFQYIDSFLAPQLTTIRILHVSHTALPLLLSLALRCPQLTHITFFPRDTSDLGPPVVSAVSVCVRGLHRIETLIADMVDQPALEHLSGLSSLWHLSLGELPPTLPVLPSDNQALFPSLQTVYFSSEIVSPTRFLEWGSKLPLVEFTAQCPAFSTPDELHPDLTLGCLKHLDVEASPISRALPVARFLARIFPSLGNISTLRDSLVGNVDWEAKMGPAALQYDRQWKQVASVLKRTPGGMAPNARW